MPSGKGPRRIIPIQKKKSLEFRFVGGVLNVEPLAGSIVWASCMMKTDKPKPPTMMTRVSGVSGHLVTFQVAKPLVFSKPCSEDISQQTQNREQVIR